MRDDTSRMAQSTSGSSLLIFPRGNDQVEPFQPLTRMHYNNVSLLVFTSWGGEKYLFPILVKEDTSKNWNSFFISQEILKFLLMTAAVLPQQGTMVEYTFGEFAEWQGWQTMWILFPDEIFVEPVCLFDLEADSWYRHELFGGYVDNKSTRRCGCQCYGLLVGGKKRMLPG